MKTNRLSFIVVLQLAALLLGSTPRAAHAQSATHPICGPATKVMAVGETYTRQFQANLTVGVVQKGQVIEVFQGITKAEVAPAGQGLLASSTANSFTLLAYAAAEGNEYIATVTYQTQLMEFKKVDGKQQWVKKGDPQAKTCNITVIVAAQKLAKLILEVGESQNVKLPGKAQIVAVSPANPLNVDVSVAAGQLSVTGKKVGNQLLKVSYTIGTTKLEMPLEVEVVGKGRSAVVEVTLLVGTTKEVPATDVNIPGLEDGKFTVFVSVENPAIASVKIVKGAAVVTGHRVGQTRAVALYEAVIDKGTPEHKSVKAKVTLKITVVAPEPPQAPGQPVEPAPNPGENPPPAPGTGAESSPPPMPQPAPTPDPRHRP